MTRRDLIALLGSTAAAWPLGVRAQQGERMRRVGVLMSVAADGPEGQARLAAFVNRLQQLGWRDGSNVQIEHRWGAGDAERSRKYAAELVALSPDIILASGDPVMAVRQGRDAIRIECPGVIPAPGADALTACPAEPLGSPLVRLRVQPAPAFLMEANAPPPHQAAFATDDALFIACK